MRYTLYVGEKCHQCEEVIHFVKNAEVECRIVNVDQSTENPPIEIFAFPALFKSETLLCYGSDIIDFLENKL